jgi:hypothetical protein
MCSVCSFQNVYKRFLTSDMVNTASLLKEKSSLFVYSFTKERDEPDFSVSMDVNNVLCRSLIMNYTYVKHIH